MNDASRGFRGSLAADRRRPEVADSASERYSSAIAVADDGSLVDRLRIEFDRRVELLKGLGASDRRFAVDCSDEEFATASSRDESFAQTLSVAGPMPSDVAEECTRGLLAALRSAHAARWSHGDLTLESFLLDAAGRITLRGAGRVQRAAWLNPENADAEAIDLEPGPQLERRWNDRFLEGAADDLRRLAMRIVPALSQAIAGEAPLWVERLRTRLDAVDGTIANVLDLDHAWRVVDSAFDSQETAVAAAAIPSAVDAGSCASIGRVDDRPIEAPDDRSLEETAQDRPSAERSTDSPFVRGARRKLTLLWVCLAGGLAALAGAVGAAIVRL